MSKTNNPGGKNAADTAKDKVVTPETENAVKDAAAAVSNTAKKASGLAKDQAQHAKATASEAAQTAADEAKLQGQNIKDQAKVQADQAKAKASELTGEAKRRAHDEAEQRKAQATGAMSTTAQDLRRAQGAVEETWMGKAFGTAAEQIEGFTRSIDNKSPEELVQTARTAARDHPGLFLAGCFAAGVAISRTLKVAGARQPEHLYDDNGERRPGTLADNRSPAQRDNTLPGVGGHTTPDGQVGIGTGTGVTDSLGAGSATGNRQ